MTEEIASPAPAGERTGLPIASGAQTWRAVRGLIRQSPGLTVAGLVASLAAAVLGVAAPYLLGILVDQIAARRASGAIIVLIILAVVAALGGLATALSFRLIIALSSRLLARLREQVMDRALTMDSAELEQSGTGEVAARISGDVEVVSESAQSMVMLVASLLTVLVSAVGFATLDWRLALAFLVVVLVYVPGLRWYVPTIGERYRVERAAFGRRAQTVLSSVTGARTVHAYGMERRMSAQIGATSKDWLAASVRALRAVQGFGNVMNGAEAVGLAALLLTGFFLVRGDLVTVGAVTAAALMFHRLFGPLGFLLFTFDDIQAAAAALARLVGIADLPPARVGANRPAATEAPITVRRLSHSYQPDRPVLRAIDLDVPNGTRLALVGASGAGKTTLAAIIAGVFTPTGGSVQLAGDDLAELDSVQLRRRVGIVTQEVHTFSGALRDDLRLARPEADDDQLLHALTRVGASDWFAGLPEGLDTQVGDSGHQLSAAESQQLALARLILADPPIVILDEAAAEAGSAGARQLEQAARAVTLGRTAVVVAHRLSQAAECEQIAVLDAGRVVELGSHAELVAAGGRYAELWSAWR